LLPVADLPYDREMVMIESCFGMPESRENALAARAEK
jgi:hypothetical protein